MTSSTHTPSTPPSPTLPHPVSVGELDLSVTPWYASQVTELPPRATELMIGFLEAALGTHKAAGAHPTVSPVFKSHFYMTRWHSPQYLEPRTEWIAFIPCPHAVLGMRYLCLTFVSDSYRRTTPTNVVMLSSYQIYSESDARDYWGKLIHTEEKIRI